MKRIFIASPFAGPTPEAIAANVALARRMCADALANGDAPYAPHLLYPQVLDDADPTQRADGIAAGHAYLAVCDEVWCWSTVSKGMASDLRMAVFYSVPVRYPWGKPAHLRPLDPAECDAFVAEAVKPSPLCGEVQSLKVAGKRRAGEPEMHVVTGGGRSEFDGLTVLATQPGEPLDLTPRPPLTAQDLRTAIDAAAKPGTFVIRRGQVPTPPRPAPAPISRSLPVVPEPDDFRDTDVLDPDVADFVAEVDDAISLSHQLPSKADDFSTSVREKLQSIREWVVENNAMTDAQQDAVSNMAGGLRRWIR